MKELNKKCAEITTTMHGARIVALLRAKDNSRGAMGSGGYSVRNGKSNGLGGTAVLVFRQMDCAPAPNHYVFVANGGQIWATHMRGFVMETLSYASIGFAHAEVDTPACILDYMEASPA